MIAVLTGLGALILALYLAQRRLIYFPARQELRQAEIEAGRLGLKPWLQEGRFLGWHAPPTAAGATGSVLVLHGNAGAAVHRTYFRTLFQSPALGANFGVYLLEYPGYGPRPGAPTESTLIKAADEAISLLHGEAPNPLLLAGESLGSVVAAIAGGKRRTEVQGMLLVTPFPNLPVLARRHYPLLPRWFLRDRFPADRGLAKYPGPVAFLIAARDSVAPPDLGLTLFDSFPGVKRLWVDQHAGHNSIDYDPHHPYWREILAFLDPAHDHRQKR